MLKLVTAVAVVAIGSPAMAQCDPDVVGSLSGWAKYVESDEDRVFRVTFAGMLEVIDVSDPTRPRLLDSVPVPSNVHLVRDLTLQGDLAAVAHRGGVSFYDISDGTQIEPLSVYLPEDLDEFDDSGGVTFVGDTAYVTFEYALYSVDVGDPTAPTTTWMMDLPGEGSYVFFQNDLLMVIFQTNHVAVINVIDPLLPIYVGDFYANFDGDDQYDLSDGKLSAVEDNGGEIFIIDVEDPTFPMEYANIDVDAMSVVGRDGFLYVGHQAGTLRVYDVMGPQPVLVSEVDLGFRAAGDISIAGDVVSVVAEDFRVQLFDVADPSMPEPIGVYRTFGDIAGIDVASGTFFTSDDTLASIDVDEPNHPQVVGDAFLGFGTDGALRVVDDLAYVTVGRDFYVVDVSDPAAPVILGVNDELTYDGTGIDVVDDRAYVVTAHGMAIFDVSDPTLPVIENSFDAFNRLYTDIDVEVGFAYLTSGFDLQIIDVTDPALPVIGTFDELNAAAVRVAGDVAYVGFLGGTYALDVSEPSKIVVLDEVDEPASRLALDGSVLVAGHADELRLYSVVNPGILDLLGIETIEDVTITGLALDEAIVGVASDDGFHVVDITSCFECAADINGDGVLDVLDFVSFQVLWTAEDPAADCDEDGAFTVLDFVCFQQVFVAGCL